MSEVQRVLSRLHGIAAALQVEINGNGIVDRRSLLEMVNEARERLRSTEAVERDAARYRWLRQHVAPEDIEFYIAHDGGDPLEDISAETDSAIDAAIAQGKK